MEEKEHFIISDDESRRIKIVRAWFTIMVVFIHSYSTVKLAGSSDSTFIPQWLEIAKYVISICISQCSVPGFFLISSILLYRKDFVWKNNLCKKTKTLLVPYLLLNSFWILFYACAQSIPFLSAYFTNEDNMIASWGIPDFLNAYIGYRGGYPILYPLWFLEDLFLLNVLAVIICRMVKKVPYLSLFVIGVLWFLEPCIPVSGMHLQALCFWTLGCIIVNQKVAISQFDRVNPKVLTILYLVMIGVEVIVRECRWSSYLHQGTVVVGIIFWWVCMTKLNTVFLSRILMLISKYSYGIYLFHEMNLTIVKKLAARVLPSNAGIQFVQYVGIPFVIILLCMGFCIVLERMFQHK